MKTLLLALCLLCAVAIVPAHAQIAVTLPEIELESGATGALVPVMTEDVSDVTVKSYDLTITYDANVIRITDVVISGTLSEGMFKAVNTNTAGVLRVSAASSKALTGSGVLMYMKVDYVSSGESPLTWDKLQYNEGNPSVAPINGRIASGVALPAEDDGGPTAFSLEENYPNPFTDRTTLSYTLPDAAPARLDVFDVLGRHVATLADGMHTAGTHTRTFEAGHMPVGLYLARLTTPHGTHTRTLTLVR